MAKRKSRKRSHQQFVEGQGDEENDHGQDQESSSYIDGQNTIVVGTSTSQEVHHYERASEVPAKIKNYFYRRHKIFSQYDQGIWMTDTAWYGVTQESVADKIASHIRSACTRLENPGILDVMAGAGGNTIGFARSGLFHRTYAFEKDEPTLRCAKHNAELYGVHDQITWFEGDCFDTIGNNRGLQLLGRDFGVIFCSPPWGGPSYRNDTVFDLATMEPYSVKHLYTQFRKYSDHIVLYLPRTSDLRQIAELVEDGKKVNVIHYCTDGSSRALCVYFGPFDFSFLGAEYSKRLQ